MADITEILRLDIDQALRDVSQLEDALDRALTRVELRVDPTAAVRQINDLADEADRALSDVDLIIDPSGIQGVERAADGVTQALNRAEGEARDVDRATQDVERNLTDSEREARQFERALARADDEAREVVATTNRIGSGFATLRGHAVGLLAAFGAAAGIGAAIRLAGDARTAFADLQDSVNAVKVVFGEASGPVLDFSENVAQTAGLSMAAFNQAASVLGSSLINVGFGADVAATKTIELTQRAADMASIFGGEVSTAVDAILSALRGEGNPIERFGVTLTETKVKAEAAALGFKEVGGEFDSTAKAAARLSIIMRETDRTAGDFAATSGDLANASKIAASEFINAKAALGESLLPVFQALLDAAPEVLAAIEDLAPSLSSLAVGAANLAKSTPGMLDFVDVLHLLVDLPRGFGQVFDNARVMIEGLGTASNAFAQALTGNVFGAVTTVIGGVKGMGDEFQRALERQNTQGLIDDLRTGGDAAETLASRLADVGKRGKLDPAFIKGLIQISGADVGRTSAALKALITDADRLNLAADDVTALRGVWLELNEAIVQSPRALDPTIAAFEDLPIANVITDFEALTLSADIAGVSLGELARSTDPMIVSMVAALDPADRLAIHLDDISTSAQNASTFLATQLRPALVDAGSALTDINKDGETTVTEFIANLEEMATAALQFKVDLASIFLISEELAAALLELGPEAAATIIAGLKADPAKILEAEAALLGEASGISQNIKTLVTQAIGLLQSRPEDVAKFTAFVATLDIPGATEAVAEGMNTALPQAFELLNIPALDLFPTGIAGRETLIDGLIAPGPGEASALDSSFADLDIDLYSEGAQSRASFMAGLSAGQAAEESRLRNSIEGVLHDAIQMRSPPKLFVDAGIASGEAFWEGFNQSDLTLKTALPSVTGKIADGSMPTAAGAGGGDVIFNLPNLETRDADVTIARATQLAGSVAGILNGNFKL